MIAFGYYAAAALLEILGCYAVWHWWRQGGSIWWVVPGIVALFGFALILAQTPPDRSGRSFAVYAGVYLVGALIWLRWVEGSPLRPTDLAGGALALAAAGLTLWGSK